MALRSPASASQLGVSLSRVIKHDAFEGSLPPRPLYVYLPPGYDDEPDRRYPILFMHDGQNVFEAFAQDSYSGTWRADDTADILIHQGRMQATIIVGVSNGSSERLAEYLPPYVEFSFTPTVKGRRKRKRSVTIHGRAEQTFRYYRDEVAPFVAANYRTLEGREHTATCGSSMGGLFSTYLAWEHPEFACHHAALSPSYWITRRGDGHLATVERIRHGPKRDLRLWLDSGTGKTGIPGQDDDNRFVTEEARDALLAAGYRPGSDFRYLLQHGAIHHESAWAARLPQVFSFLMPAADHPSG